MKSPCINVCKIHNNICRGCKRTRKEIATWKRMTEEQQQKVLDRIREQNEKDIQSPMV